MKNVSCFRLLRGALLLGMALLVCSVASAQSTAIRGRVVGKADRQPVTGATIVQQGTSNATTTNAKGEFSLTVPASSELDVSFVGYKPVAVKAAEGMLVELDEDIQSIDQVVVTGYSSEKKADITGSVSVVKLSDITGSPTANVMSNVQGRVPGVNIFNDGTPGGVGTGTLIRGTTTINDSSPLYVIDGVQTRANLATLLNSKDVESIQILKDAASASIYGTQAANGVIIITTKRAKGERTNVTFDATFSAQMPRQGIEMLNAQQWGEVYWQAYKNDGLTPRHDLYGSGATPVIPEFINGAKTIRSGDTNWADEVYKTSFVQDYNVTITHGSKRSNSLFSVNYVNDKGTIKYTNFKRINARMNAEYNFLDNRLRVGENLTVSNWSEVFKPGGIEELAIAQHPIIPVYDINGGYAGPTQGVGDKPNPVRLLDQQKENMAKQWRIFGNAYIEIEPLKNLVLRSNFGINYRTGRTKNFEPKWQEGDRTVDKNLLTQESNYDFEWIWSNVLSYSRTLGRHSFSALVGTEARKSENGFLKGVREKFIIEDPNFLYLSAGDGKQTNGALGGGTAMVSYFGKVNYAFADKYLLAATVRRDASSRFGKENNAGVFPAVSAGWRISQENFMKRAKWISDLKLRVSWGQNGNDLMDNEATYTKYITNLVLAGYDMSGINQGVIMNGLMKDRTGNPNVKWEITTQLNFGLDASLFNNRLNFTADYYIKNTDGMLIERPYIGVIGEGGYMAYNGAGIRNNGLELSLGWRDNVGSDFSYEVTVNTSFYKNEITELPEDIYYTWGGGNGVDKSIVGHPLGSWMGYRADGLYRTAAELNNGITQEGKGLGRIRYQDLNGDNEITDKDREWLGSDRPRMIGGLNIALRYKQFDFSMFWNGMVRDAWNNSKFYTDFFQLWTGNHGTRLLNAWNKDENFDSSIPALTSVNLNDEGRGSTYFIENGSYIKLKSLQIGYTLPGRIADMLRMSSLRVYAMGQNLWTITNYSGPDPEGLGYPYPIPTSVILGISFGF